MLREWVKKNCKLAAPAGARDAITIYELRHQVLQLTDKLQQAEMKNAALLKEIEELRKLLPQHP